MEELVLTAESTKKGNTKINIVGNSGNTGCVLSEKLVEVIESQILGWLSWRFQEKKPRKVSISVAKVKRQTTLVDNACASTPRSSLVRAKTKLKVCVFANGSYHNIAL